MSSEQIPLSLRRLIGDVLDIAPEEVNADLKAGSVEAWDSFGHLQLILAVEGEYGVQFDPQRIPELTSVGSIYQELVKKGATL